MNVTNRVVFTNEDNLKHGFLIWGYGKQFNIYDENMIEVDCFNVDVVNERQAHQIAINHFMEVEASFKAMGR